MNTRTVYNTTYEYINYRYVFTPINNHVARITTLLRCRLPHDEYFERVGARTHVPRDESNLLRGAPTKLEKTNCILYMCICLIPMCIWYYSGIANQQKPWVVFGRRFCTEILKAAFFEIELWKIWNKAMWNHTLRYSSSGYFQNRISSLLRRNQRRYQEPRPATSSNIVRKPRSSTPLPTSNCILRATVPSRGHNTGT